MKRFLYVVCMSVLPVISVFSQQNGFMTITATVSGVEIYLDSEKIGTTRQNAPIIKEVSTGKHVVLAVREGYKNSIKEVYLMPGQNLKINFELEQAENFIVYENKENEKLKPEYGSAIVTAKLNAQLVEAQLYIDNTYAGKTVAQIGQLQVGTHEFKVSYNNLSATKHVYISKDKQTKIDLVIAQPKAEQKPQVRTQSRSTPARRSRSAGDDVLYYGLSIGGAGKSDGGRYLNSVMRTEFKIFGFEDDQGYFFSFNISADNYTHYYENKKTSMYERIGVDVGLHFHTLAAYGGAGVGAARIINRYQNPVWYILGSLDFGALWTINIGEKSAITLGVEAVQLLRNFDRQQYVGHSRYYVFTIGYYGISDL